MMDCIPFMKRNAPYVANMPDLRIDFAHIAALEWMEKQMEITNNDRPMLVNGLSCICGYNKIYHSKVKVDDVSDVNQLACPNCGIIMRSPNTDENGEWLKKHWKKTHETMIPERDEYKRRAEAADIRRWEDFSLISAVWYGKDAYFRQDDGMVYSRISGEYMTFDQAVNEFVCELHEDN